MKPLEKKLADYRLPQMFMEQGIYPFYHPIETGQDTEVILRGKKTLMFGSNSYLGLTRHPEIIEAGKKALDKYGTGASGSRLMNGNLDLHEELEEKLAIFVGKESATVFSTGFQSNLGSIAALAGRNDYILLDEKNHASIIESTRLSFARVLKYKHNDMEDLENKLKNLDQDRIILIVMDGIFSMEGDIAPLDKITNLADKYNASVYVDDAHSLGVLGRNGAGTADHFGVTDKVDLIMGTFSKSLASLGGFVAGSHDAINYLKHNARALLFSASIPPASAATVLKALEVIKREPERIKHLWENTHYAKKLLVENGFDIGHSTTPIIPIHVGDDVKTYVLATRMLQDGVYVNPVVHPAVEKGKAILRYSLMATHTKEQIERSIDSLIKSSKNL